MRFIITSIIPYILFMDHKARQMSTYVFIGKGFKHTYSKVFQCLFSLKFNILRAEIYHKIQQLKFYILRAS